MNRVNPHWKRFVSVDKKVDVICGLECDTSSSSLVLILI